MDSMLLFLVSFVFGLSGFSLMALWYVVPRLRAWPLESALGILIAPHAFRYIGLAFLIPGVTAEVLPAAFALPAAYGDLLAAVLAVVALLALRCRWNLTIPLVWVFNLVGAADLLFAVTQGLRLTAPAALGATYFIPAVLVPALLVTHVLIFVLLLRPKAAQRRSSVR